VKFMKKIVPESKGLPVYQFDKNFFTGPSNLEVVKILSERGVSTIFSVLPKTTGFAFKLNEYAKKYGIKVVYFNHSAYRSPDFSLLVAKQAFKLSRTKKVAVCCIDGNFSTHVVGSDFLKLKRSESELKRKKLKVPQIKNKCMGIVRRRIK